MRALILLLSLSTLLISSIVSAEPTAPETDDDKAFYALGMMLGQNIEVFSLNERELGFVLMGLSESVQGKARAEFKSFQDKLRDIAKARMDKKAKANEAKGSAFLAQEAKKAGATQSETGLVMSHIKEGTGPSPKATDKVKVHYKGTLINGTEFDSSFKRNKPAEFPLNRVIPCWTEGVQKMKVGGKARLVCPAKIAYGPRGTPGIPPNSTLIFEVELLEIMPEVKKAPKKAAAKPVKIQAKPAAQPAAKPATKPATQPAAKPAQ